MSDESKPEFTAEDRQKLDEVHAWMRRMVRSAEERLGIYETAARAGTETSDRNEVDASCERIDKAFGEMFNDSGSRR